ncbi:MAG TPA: MATE family efflux transporter [Candidatus Dependentiae bacterium]|nr:MATE family efflux transporter [Candidatus Dependentiae bacterium]HRQ62358.1 MATE family efflux transporter [Candidatus Dependentiae bacterium]
MKKGIVTSYVSGLSDTHGESYTRILKYFVPEFVTAFLLYSLPFWLDAYFISSLKSTSTYATLGVTSTLVHLLIKVAEGVSVGTVILSGMFNSRGEYKDVGRSARDAFWLNMLVGAVFASALYLGAYRIYAFYGVPDKMIQLGVPFLRLQAMGLLFMFTSLSFIGFLRGIKNTKVPMAIFITGIFTFVIFDYVLIFGKMGFPALGLEGSAIASVIRYGVMALAAIGYTFLHPHNRKYGIELFSIMRDISYGWRLVVLSLPVILDKSIMALAYVWLSSMLCTLGKEGAAAFSVLKDMERFAILPALAFAQVITLLVSNDYGVQNWDGIKSNTKKILFLSSVMVIGVLLFFGMFYEQLICLFDTKGKFTGLAAQAFPILSVLIFFDLLQLILAGALRASGNANIVMIVRLAVCVGFFGPLSYLFSKMQIADNSWRFILIYGAFYVGNALMSLAYIHRFRGKNWNKQSI